MCTGAYAQVALQFAPSSGLKDSMVGKAAGYAYEGLRTSGEVLYKPIAAIKPAWCVTPEWCAAPAWCALPSWCGGARAEEEVKKEDSKEKKEEDNKRIIHKTRPISRG